MTTTLPPTPNLCYPGQRVFSPREEWRDITNSSSKNEAAGPKQEDAQLSMCLVVKVKSDVIKNNIV